MVRIRNVTHRLGYLNIQSPVGSVTCVGSKEVKYVSGDSHWEVIALPHFQVTLCFVLEYEDVISQLPTLVKTCHASLTTVD